MKAGLPGLRRTDPCDDGIAQPTVQQRIMCVAENHETMGAEIEEVDIVPRQPELDIGADTA